MIEAGNKVKDILKEPSLDLDDQDNEYLFGEKFQEKLQNYKHKAKVNIDFNGSTLKDVTPQYIKPTLSGKHYPTISKVRR